jgi:hypothetical protein
MAPYKSLTPLPAFLTDEDLGKRMTGLVMELLNADSVKPPTVKTIIRSHRALHFGAGGHGDLRQRNERARYAIRDAQDREIALGGIRGSKASIQYRLRDICQEFVEEGNGLKQPDVVCFETVLAVARLYVALLRTQPFPYGNDGPALVALCRAYGWLKLPVSPPHKEDDDFHDGLDEALLGRAGDDACLAPLTERLMYFLKQPFDATAPGPLGPLPKSS